MNFFLFIMIVIWSLLIHGMEISKPQTIVKMPKEDKLIIMLIGTPSLFEYVSDPEKQKFYELAETDIDPEGLSFILKGFYKNFEFLYLGNNLSKKLKDTSKMAIVEECTALARQLFSHEQSTIYWDPIRKELIDDIQSKNNRKNIVKRAFSSKKK